MKLNERSLSWAAGVLGLSIEKRIGEILLGSFETDTRRSFGPNAIFVALEGPNFDGHSYIQEAVAKGAKCILSSKVLKGIHVPVLKVEDTTVALQRLAQDWRESKSTKIIAITGSNGKTIVKDLLASMLSCIGTTYRSPGSYNSQVGVALSLLKLREIHEFAVIEAGISKPGEMKKLKEMIQPNFGIWTNIGEAHLGGLRSQEGIAKEKSILFEEGIELLVFPESDKKIRESIGGNQGKTLGVEIENLEKGYFRYGNHDYHIRIPGEHNKINAALAIALSTELGVQYENNFEVVENFRPARHRLEMYTLSSGVTLLNDSYNADPTSMRSAFSVLAHYGQGHRRIAIIGDMLDLGVFAHEAHQQVGREIAKVVDRLFLVGEFAADVKGGAQKGGLDSDKISIHSLSELGEVVSEYSKEGDYILYKASHALHLDVLAAKLFESVASTRLEIDLNKVASNIHRLREVIGEDCELMAVIKSFAYGSDSTRIAMTLIQNGVSALVVAFPNEAEPLRRKGIEVPIIVTNVSELESDKISKYDLEAVVSQKSVVDALSESAKGEVNIHIEVDTGMRRTGIDVSDVLDFAKYIISKKNVRIVGIMTHLAAADDSTQDDFTLAQIQSFDEVLELLGGAGIDYGRVHIANTAAAIRFPEARRDATRIGLGIYGFLPSKSVKKVVKSTLRMSTRIIALRKVLAGQSVGYGRTWVAKRDSLIGTIACGYNDGFRRFMSNGGEVLVNGQRAKVVGNVCMDVSMVDLSDVKGPLSEGDEVVIFGKQGDERIAVEEIAKRGNTINYEILTGISSRVERIFLKS